MIKGLLSGFVILFLAIAMIMFAYGKKTIADMSSAKTDAYVDETVENPALVQKNWIDYTPITKKFHAKFPTLPQHATDKSLDAKTKQPKQYEMYISENHGKVFMISVISFLTSDKVDDEESTLKNIIDDMVAAKPDNKLEKIQFGTYEGLKDANFTIVNDAYTVLGRAFIDKNQLYVLTILSKTAEESKNEFNYFAQSFKLKNNEPENLVPFPIEK